MTDPLYQQKHAHDLAAAHSEEIITRAHQFISADLYAIERMLQVGDTPDYLAIFGAHLPSKIAALILLTRQKLLDIHHAELPSRELRDARNDLANYVQILYHLQVVEAFVIVHQLAQQYGGESMDGLWGNVARRSLLLLAMLPKYDARTLLFLQQQPLACRQLQIMAQSHTADVAAPARRLLNAFNDNDKIMESAAEPTYIRLYRQYESDLAADNAIGISSWLTAKERIERAVLEGDVPGVILWICEGSTAAMRETLRFAASIMSPAQYVDLLQRCLLHEKIIAERQIIVVLELGARNRQSGKPDGDATINRILTQLAMDCTIDKLTTSEAAIRSLASVQALQYLMALLEHAKEIAVAEQAIIAMRDLRHLPMVSEFVFRRPQLSAKYHEAQIYLHNLQDLKEAAAESLSSETSLVYLTQLKELLAVAELQELAKRNIPVAEMAQQMLSEIDPSLAVNYYND